MMPFSAYKTISGVLQEFQITYSEENFIEEIQFKIPDYFREDLALVMREGVVDNSEFAICENFIYPILKEVWKNYCTQFVLWSHQALNYDEKLNGFPEYILAQKSPLGKLVFAQPYFVLIEAKQDNFEAGWGQCIAEMIAAQKLNVNPEQEFFGIASNGKFWEFGKLKSNRLTRNQTFYTIQELDKLFAAINYIFQQCELLLNAEISTQTSH
jgi:hypothetical protein